MNVTQLQAAATQIAQQFKLPPGLLESVVQHESGWNPNARSPVGALGLTQLMPSTAAGMGVNPLDPIQSLKGGAQYLRSMLDRFQSVPLAVAAYNAGPGAVSKYGGIPPYKETQDYVKNVMGSMSGIAPPSPGGTTSPGGVSVASPQTQTRQLPNFTDADLGLLSKVGSDSAAAAGAASQPDPGVPLPAIAPRPTTPPNPDQSNPQVPLLPVQGLTGNQPMIFGGRNDLYSNLHFASHVDFQHVNPRLLQAINKVAAKQGVIAEITSGYRSNSYSPRVGGFAGDPHTKGLAVDAYIGGHPIGEVLGPETWQKLGIVSGAVPGFYKGKPDPEHLQLAGVPYKGGPSA